MILQSIKNFVTTYTDLFGLVLRHDRDHLLFVITVYLLSFVFLAVAFFLVLVILRSSILGGDFGFNNNVDFGLLGYQFSISKVVCIFFLVGSYLISSVSAYVAEMRWFKTIENIVKTLAENKTSQANGSQQKKIRMGAISTIRVSGILLNILSPSLIGLFSFVYLFYLQWQLGLFILILVATATVLYLRVGRKTKKISLGALDDEDDDMTTTVESHGLETIFDRLTFVSNLFQLKAKSKLIANFLFVLAVAGLVFYLLTITKDAETLFDMIVSCALIYLCFNSLKVFGSKAVPLSRQYGNVKEFISVNNDRA